ncbi:MAG TPA: metallophosphoesterase [Anaeromyxobacteraceae bacterium]
MRTIAHISDLHIGRDASTDLAASTLSAALLREGVDDVLLTGDVTDRGRCEERATFERIFAPLASRLLVVPGNHDRLGDDTARAFMAGARVLAELRPGLFVLRLDSTAPHNRRLIDSHGELTPATIVEVERGIDGAPRGALVVLMLHHHLLPLPADHLGERLASMLGWPNAAELDLGRALVDRLRGRCDLVLHGHRHAASEVVLFPGNGRALHVLNAGSTPDLGRVRLVTHDAGRIVQQRWLELDGQAERRASSGLRFRRSGSRAAAALA